jgi:2-dehydropantoate 2-reductase
MKILVMGAGAVGSCFGARLAAAGEAVTVYGRGDHLRAMREHGLAVKSIRGEVSLVVNAIARPRDFAPYDLTLFCVKAYDSDQAAAAMRRCLAEGGAILTVQNGVENEARLAEIFGRERVMGGNARVGLK